MDSTRFTTARAANPAGAFSAAARAAGLAAFVALPILASLAASAWIWLTLRNPILAVDLVSRRHLTPLVRHLAGLLYAALVEWVRWLS
jgi:hypothetical protein